MMRAVVDTNILVRAVIKPRGSVGPVLQRLRQRGIISGDEDLLTLNQFEHIPIVTPVRFLAMLG